MSTDALYFAGRLDVPGAMFTASHNPARYNGLKLCRERAAPIGSDTGPTEIMSRDGVESITGEQELGLVEQSDFLDEYAEHCRSFVDASALVLSRSSIDAGNGMAGLTVPSVFDPLPFEVVPLFFELDGTFPNHPANPIEPENLVDLQKAVIDGECDAGIAFDGDADRMFLVDESGELVSGSTTTALVAASLLKKSSGSR